MFKIVAAILVILTIPLSTAAHASLLIEPYGGYSLGNLSLTPLSGTDSSSTINGFVYGGRAGFMLHHFVIMAYEYQALSAQEKPSGGGTALNWNQSTQFATLGFQAPYGLRLLGSYGFQLNASEAVTPNAANYTGSAYKLALGWAIQNDIAINAEYSIYNLTNITQNSLTAKISDLYSKTSYSAIMFNLSLPFTFFSGGSGGGASSSTRSRP